MIGVKHLLIEEPNLTRKLKRKNQASSKRNNFDILIKSRH
jgi:hypothetical protein